MPLSPITFASGHQLVDNGCGDYCVQCPDGHKQRPTVFTDQAMGMVRHPERFECSRCDSPLGARTEGKVWLEELRFVDPYTCEHAVGEIRQVKLREMPSCIERTTLFPCVKCGATIEAVDPIFPNHPEFAQYAASAKEAGNG